MKIDYAGEELRPEHRALIERLLEKTHELQHVKQLKVHLKEYRTGGLRRKFDIHLEALLDLPHHGFISARGFSWMFNLAAKKAIKRLKKQINKIVRKEDKMSLPKRLAKVMKK